MKFSIIAAVCNGVIGVDEGIPWRDRYDLMMFKDITSRGPVDMINILIVGRVTYETLPQLVGPRRLLVISSKEIDGVLSARSLSEALQICASAQNIHKVFVIGGGKLYKEAIHSPLCHEMYITNISQDICPKISGNNVVMFPDIPNSFRLQTSTMLMSGSSLMFYTNTRGNSPVEKNYLDILSHILQYGSVKPDRTMVGTISSFGQVLRHDFTAVGDGYTFPLLTTKKMFIKGIIKELLFFLRGQIDNDILLRDGVKIWTDNTTREFLDSRGLQHMETGSLGKAYGFQWRHWGAEYRGKNYDYSGMGHDQIADILHKLKHDPYSRRIVLSAWNVSDLAEMCLEPCHTMYVFNVTPGSPPTLSCHLTQRSGDMFLGVPFNLASAALLTMIFAKLSGLVPGTVMLTIVDAHIYRNHIEQCQEQISRIGSDLPIMRIKDLKFKTVDTIEFDDFILSCYNPLAAISAKMAV